MIRYFLILVTGFAILACKTKPQNEGEHVGLDERPSSLKTYVGKDYLIDDQHSYLGFKIKYFGYSPVRGRFNGFDGTLFYVEGVPASFSTSVFVDINTINTGEETRDDDLKREGSWFDAKNHPIASFQSSTVRGNDSGGFTIDGILTIKGISKNISIEFELPTPISRDWAGNEQIDFTGKTIINRQDFGIVGGDFWSTIMENGLTQLSDEVEIELNLHCRRPDYIARYEDAQETDMTKKLLTVIKNGDLKTALTRIDSLFSNEAISSGKLSTIGYTLQEWKMYQEAHTIFDKKMELFGPSTIVFNQLGLNHLYQQEVDKAHEKFEEALKIDATNSRAVEYLRILQWSSK